MRIQPLSFLLGLGAAMALPLFSRVLRPLAVEAAVAGMGLFDEARRLVAEQMENLEDMAAEARARREELLASNGDLDAPEDEIDADADAEPVAAPSRARRRANGADGRRAS